MAETGRLTRPTLAAADPVMLLRAALIGAALAIWQAISVSGLLFRDVVPPLGAIGGALGRLLLPERMQVEQGILHGGRARRER